MQYPVFYRRAGEIVSGSAMIGWRQRLALSKDVPNRSVREEI